MIVKIAWKNIWRRPVRSLVVIVAVALGLWAGMFMVAFTNGLNQQRLEDQLNNSLGHIKFVHPAFAEEKQVGHTLPQVAKIAESLKKQPEVQAITTRVNLYGMASSSAGSFGVDIYGITPATEQKVFAISQQVVAGQYFNTRKRLPVVIGQKLATRLGLKIGRKVVLSFQTMAGELTAGAFRVVGIYQITNTTFEESHVFVQASDLRALLGGRADLTHQVIAKLADYRQAPAVAARLQAHFPQCKVQSWEEISPEMAYIDTVMRYFFYIFIGIILLALAMGIVNTMLMAVLERTRELGMLMAIGMSRGRILRMIMTETFLLTCTGLPIGLLLAWASVALSAQAGLDLSAVGEGFGALGYRSVIYPHLQPGEYLQICVMVFFTALLAALYPAWQALRLRPAEAIRKV
ncbi:MAG: ABC transporter permease [Microscillaceae bacterium]|nr:ABC transporter permease [Microscillaceae bacterium]